MKIARFLKLFMALFVLIGIVSCSSSSDVASNRMFQKRKYNKGWHSNTSPNYSNKNSGAPEKSESNSIAGSQNDSSHTSTFSHSTDSNTTKFITTAAVPQDVSAKRKTKRILESARANLIPATVVASRNSIVQKGNGWDDQAATFDPWLSEEAVRVILAILAVLILVFTGISPLAVWVSVGPGPALRLNTILFVAFILCLIIFVMTLFYITMYGVVGGLFALAILFGFFTIALGIVSFVHALVSIIRGY